MTRKQTTDVVTFGCRLNAYDSEVMRSHADAAGGPKTVIVNTCAVTSEAARQGRQAVRRARTENPDARIIATGCAVQLDPDTFADMDEVDLVLGNEEKLRPESYRTVNGEAPRVRVNDIMSVSETALHMIDGFAGKSRAFVQIQTGCDHRCTFCIIPFGRGNARSVPAEDVVRQIQRLIDNGYNEIALTGVDLTSYGTDLENRPSLGVLVQRILTDVPDLKRLRLSSIDSIEADDALLDAITGNERVMPHIHLSLQHGDDLILKRMKRRHARAHAVDFCRAVRAARPDIVFGADLIAGFPTETEEMFENSLSLVDDCALTYLHVFPYSPRPGTPAARMPQVDGREIKARAARLRAKGDAALQRYFAERIGRTETCLVEQPTMARTDGYAPVTLSALQTPGDLIQVTMTGFDARSLHGRPQDLSEGGGA